IRIRPFFKLFSAQLCPSLPLKRPPASVGERPCILNLVPANVRKRTPDRTGSGCAWFTSPTLAEVRAPALAAYAGAKAEPSAHPRDLLPGRCPDPQSKRSKDRPPRFGPTWVR